MNQHALDALNLKDPDTAWALLTPSPHLTDYPVDDLDALYRVYVDHCWDPPLSRTQSAWQREHRSEGQFKYAVIDARFECKGCSLYERAILYVGTEAAIREEILQGTPPTYYALKPEGTDARLFIHPTGQESPRESRVPDGVDLHEVTAGVLNALGPRRYHQVSVRCHTGVTWMKLVGEGSANPRRLTRRQLESSWMNPRIGWQIPFDFEEPDPVLPYGYWIDRSGTLIPVHHAGGHEAVAAGLVGGSEVALSQGYFRVVMNVPKREIHFEVTGMGTSPTLNQISALETLARNYDWSVFNATLGRWVHSRKSQQEWRKNTLSGEIQPKPEQNRLPEGT